MALTLAKIWLGLCALAIVAGIVVLLVLVPVARIVAGVFAILIATIAALLVLDDQ